MKNIIALILTILPLVSPFASFANNNSSNEIDVIAGKLLERITDSAFDEAAKLFHYPANMSPAERDNESKAISHMLKVLRREFGKPTSITPLQKQYAFYSVSAGSGDIPYWQQHPDVLQKNYDVTFSKEGSGYIVVQLCNISGEWEIRSVSFAFPVERADAMRRITEISNIIMNEMKPFMNEYKNTKESI